MTQPSIPAKLALEGGSPFRTTPFPKRTPFGDEEIALVTEAIRSQNLFGPSGDKVAALEHKFAALYGVKYATASTSGTAAIHVAIGALNPNPGDEIITGPITDAGSIIPILYQGCIPIFADIDETYNIDPADVERKITDRTAAILAIHLFGNACKIDELAEIARRHNLPLIEDCSQTHAIQYKGRTIGTWGDIAAFSFQQSKHMTTGDGGMTITNHEKLAERMALFCDKGWTRKPGYGARSYAFLAPNYRMTELQGAVGLAQVNKVRGVIEKRMALGHYLSALIGEVEGITPMPMTPGSEHGYWLYALRVDDWPIQPFAEALSKEGVGAGAGYTGDPIYLCMDALMGKKTFGNSSYPLDGSHGGRQIEYTKGLCPRAEEALQQMVTIGLNENYSPRDIEDMAGAIRKVAELLPKPQ
ncbi:MAG: DegT/DnrJ/EryC1/StrS family aminotransferase [Chloroflexi bacterium]|nr:DegT/DnrJ/EryC1/StrS family aminotransferase [Chloroflexota bacterium]